MRWDSCRPRRTPSGMVCTSEPPPTCKKPSTATSISLPSKRSCVSGSRQQGGSNAVCRGMLPPALPCALRLVCQETKLARTPEHDRDLDQAEVLLQLHRLYQVRARTQLIAAVHFLGVGST